MPRCSPQMDGQEYCKFGMIYECQLIGPNSMERRTGWRWKVDILRACAESSPAIVDQQSGPPPNVTFEPEQNSVPDAEGRQGGSDAPVSRGTMSKPGTMYIRP